MNARRRLPNHLPQEKKLHRTAAVACAAAVAFCAGARAADAPQTPPTGDVWFTLHGDRQEPHKNLIEVRPEPVGLDRRVMMDVRVSRGEERTSFRGQKYRSYYARATINCATQKAWYRWLNYHAQPQWAGPVIAREEYTEGEAPVLFKDVQGEPYRRMISAACKVRHS